MACKGFKKNGDACGYRDKFRGEYCGYHVRASSSVVEGEMCPICHDNVASNNDRVTLSCKHEYHRKCIKGWLSRKDTCPMCRDSVSSHIMESLNVQRNEEFDAESIAALGRLYRMAR